MNEELKKRIKMHGILTLGSIAYLLLLFKVIMPMHDESILMLLHLILGLISVSYLMVVSLVSLVFLLFLILYLIIMMIDRKRNSCLDKK